mmetsp:Transcript_36108/g.81943  ORF Transcript_36108/g.81943 Transcript_36108/m.81943 type:complete len:91 (+) Transcript_36108:537-809(+)
MQQPPVGKFPATNRYASSDYRHISASRIQIWQAMSQPAGAPASTNGDEVPSASRASNNGMPLHRVKKAHNQINDFISSARSLGEGTLKLP